MSMQALVMNRPVAVGNIISEGGLDYEVKAYEAIKSAVTKRTRHIHWCILQGATECRAPVIAINGRH